MNKSMLNELMIWFSIKTTWNNVKNHSWVFCVVTFIWIIDDLACICSVSVKTAHYKICSLCLYWADLSSESAGGSSQSIKGTAAYWTLVVVEAAWTNDISPKVMPASQILPLFYPSQFLHTWMSLLQSLGELLC